jgi:hypothetical protein
MTSTSDDTGGHTEAQETVSGRRALGEMGNWIYGGLLGLLAFLGLLLASRAQDAAFEWTGLALFAFAVLLIFGLVHRNTGRG